jgi:hypothetical protein
MSLNLNVTERLCVYIYSLLQFKLNSNNVLEKHTAFFLKAKVHIQEASKKQTWSPCGLARPVYGATATSVISVGFCRTASRYCQEDRNIVVIELAYIRGTATCAAAPEPPSIFGMRKFTAGHTSPLHVSPS